MKALWLGYALFLPGIAMAGCDNMSGYGVNDLNFTQEPVKTAVQRVIQDTPYSVNFVGVSKKMVSAYGVTGAVDQVLSALTKQAGLSYSVSGCLITIAPEAVSAPVVNVSAPAPSQPMPTSVWANNPAPITPVTAAPLPTALPTSSAIVATAPAPSMPLPDIALAIREGDSIKAKVTEYAKAHNYSVNWSGSDLFASRTMTFSGSNFEDTLNKLFVASKISGVIANDEGGVVNVYVQ
jgi:hypothetical protein